MTTESTRHTVGLCAVVLMVFAARVSAETVFLDRFDDGNATDGLPVTWVPDSGSWDASSGDYQSSGTLIRRSIVPQHLLGDTSVRSRIRLSGNGSQGQGAGIAFRRVPGNNLQGYGASLLDDGTIGFLRVDGGPIPVFLGAAVAPFDVVGSDVMLQVDAFGDELSLWAWPAGSDIPEIPQVVVNDSTYATGTIGLYSNESTGASAFRFVHAASTHIPEPSTIALLGMLGIGLLCAARRQLISHRTSKSQLGLG